MSKINPIDESISALVDNEGFELDVQRVLNSLSEPDSDSTRSLWQRYHTQAAAMRRERQSLDCGDLAARVSAAIRDEAVVSHSKTQFTSLLAWRGPLGKTAVAATVALAFVLGFETLNDSNLSPSPILADGQATQALSNEGLETVASNTPLEFQNRYGLSARTVSTSRNSGASHYQNYVPLTDVRALRLFERNSMALPGLSTNLLNEDERVRAELQSKLNQWMQAYSSKPDEGALQRMPVRQKSDASLDR